MLDLTYWLQFWYIFPVALFICVTVCLLAMEGAVLFTPSLLFLFPVLSTKFPRLSVDQVITIGLIVEYVGYSSSAFGYWYQRRVDMRVAWNMLLISVPPAVTFSLISSITPGGILLLIFGLLLFGLALLLLRTAGAEPAAMKTPGHSTAPPEGFGDSGWQHRIDRCGCTYIYRYKPGWLDRLIAATGEAFVGLIGIGIGEVASTLLLTSHRLPIHIATATSTFVVAATVLSAASVHTYTTLQHGVSIPWDLAATMAIAVLLGGQIAPRISPYFTPKQPQRAMVFMFIFVGTIVVFRALV